MILRLFLAFKSHLIACGMICCIALTCPGILLGQYYGPPYKAFGRALSTVESEFPFNKKCVRSDTTLICTHRASDTEQFTFSFKNEIVVSVASTKKVPSLAADELLTLFARSTKRLTDAYGEPVESGQEQETGGYYHLWGPSSLAKTMMVLRVERSQSEDAFLFTWWLFN